MKRLLREPLIHFLLIGAGLLSVSVAVVACPVCQGLSQSSAAEQLVAAPAAVLALPTADAGQFRVIQVVKGDQPTGGTVEGDYPRNAPPPNNAEPTSTNPLLMVRDNLFPTWTILGAINANQVDWLRQFTVGKPAADRSLEDWRTRVALVVPKLDNSEPLVADLAYAELTAAPYPTLRAAKPHLDAAALRRQLADPELTARRPLRLLLLGIAGNAQDAAKLERRLESAGQPDAPANLSAWLTADMELRGAERVAWVESKYLVDRNRPPAEIKAALLALSVQGGAKGVIPRERVIQSYRAFMKAHPDIAGYVATDLAAWEYWDAVPDYLALMKSDVRQQYPSRLAILAYLRQSPDAGARDFAQQAAPVDGVAERSNPFSPQR